MPATPAVQRVLPQRLLGRFIYMVARSRRGWIKDPLIDWFARTYAIDLDESEASSLRDFASFNDFFTRALSPDARPIAADPLAVVSPADGTLTNCGTLTDGQLLQAKGREYSLAELLAEDGPETQALRNGRYATIYLAPHNYHRVHAPLGGRLVRTRYVPGRRFCVDGVTARAIPRLFSRNERVVCWFEGDHGVFAVVLVGALNVASISTVTLGEIAPGPPRVWQEGAPRAFVKGAEIGRFNLGSTVIVLVPNGVLEWDATLAAGAELLMGAPLGRLLDERGAPAAGGRSGDCAVERPR